MNHPAHFYDEPTRPPGRPAKFPLRTLAMGESIFFPGVRLPHINKVRRHYRPHNFMIRSVVEDGVAGVRVTRVDEPPPFHTGRPSKYPFRTMAIGDSIFIPGKTAKEMFTLWRRHRPLRFTAKTLVVNGQIGVRMWRIA